MSSMEWSARFALSDQTLALMAGWCAGHKPDKCGFYTNREKNKCGKRYVGIS